MAKTKISSTIVLGQRVLKRNAVSPQLLSERSIGKEMSRLIKQRNIQH